MNRIVPILACAALGGLLACGPAETGSPEAAQTEVAQTEGANADARTEAASPAPTESKPPAETASPTPLAPLPEVTAAAQGDAHYPQPMEVFRCLRLADAGDAGAGEACREAARLAPGNPDVQGALDKLGASAETGA